MRLESLISWLTCITTSSLERAMLTSLAISLNFMTYDHTAKRYSGRETPSPEIGFGCILRQASKFYITGLSKWQGPFLWSLRTLNITSNAESVSFSPIIPDQRNTLQLGPPRLPYWGSYELPVWEGFFFSQCWRALVSPATCGVRVSWPHREQWGQ